MMIGMVSLFLTSLISFFSNMELTSSSLRCIQVIAGVLGRAGESGQAKRLLAAQTGEITWLPPPGLGKPYDEKAEKRKAEAAAKKQKEEERRTLAERGQLKNPMGEFKGAGPEFRHAFHLVSQEEWEKLRDLQQEVKSKVDEGLGGLDLKMKDLLEASEASELSEADQKIVKKIKQQRDARGVRDADPLSEEDEELVKTMEMEGASELVVSMQHARKFAITREERERLAGEVRKEITREMEEESGLELEMIDLFTASQMSELTDRDERILVKLQKMRGKRGVRDLDDVPWNEEEEELVNKMDFARGIKRENEGWEDD
jgi:hypothetical protein